MTGRPLVSVIIPFYNEGDRLGDCLDSVSRQRFRSLEIIAIDDGSTDGSAGTARRFARGSGRACRVFRLPHSGPGRARNFGARKARGKILVFVDADMTAHPGFLGRIIAPIRSGREDGTFVVDEMVSNPGNIWSRAWSLAHGLPPTRRIPAGFRGRSRAYRAVLRSAFLRAGGNREERGVGEDELDTRKIRPGLGVRGAILYHANPAGLSDVLSSGRWFGRGKASYIYGGRYLRLLFVHSLPRSVVAAVWGAVRHFSPFFLLFKLLLDASIFWGLVEGRLFGRKAK